MIDALTVFICHYFLTTAAVAEHLKPKDKVCFPGHEKQVYLLGPYQAGQLLFRVMLSVMNATWQTAITRSTAERLLDQLYLGKLTHTDCHNRISPKQRSSML
jgi:hypothetical protein